jgi:cell division transport system permease protein
MAISVGYVTREAVTNLRRNLGMTIAAVLTVMVSLALVGMTLLLYQGVNNATIQWKKNVELSVFMKTDTTPKQLDAMKKKLKSIPTVKSFFYVDRKATYREFQRWTANSRKAYEDVRPQDLPTSYRIIPKDVKYVDSIGQAVERGAGVYNVAYAKQEIQKIRQVTSAIQVGMAVAASVLVVCAILLILNTIQIAIYNRRREVAVMKLVGATNWFIRVPFMMEGMIQGIVGALVAIVAFTIVWGKLKHHASTSTEFLYRLVPVEHNVVMTALLIFAIGAGLGIVGSAFAVRRYLRV